MLYQVLERMVERGATEGLEDKVDVFFAAGRLTQEEYGKLTSLLAKEMA